MVFRRGEDPVGCMASPSDRLVILHTCPVRGDVFDDGRHPEAVDGEGAVDVPSDAAAARDDAGTRSGKRGEPVLQESRVLGGGRRPRYHRYYQRS